MSWSFHLAASKLSKDYQGRQWLKRALKCKAFDLFFSGRLFMLAWLSWRTSHYVYFQFPISPNPWKQRQWRVFSPLLMAHWLCLSRRADIGRGERGAPVLRHLAGSLNEKGRVPGDHWRINSSVQLHVMPLCVSCSMPPNTGQDPLIPPYLSSLISAAVFGYPTKRNVPLSKRICTDFQASLDWVQNRRFLSVVFCFAAPLKSCSSSSWRGLILFWF